MVNPTPRQILDALVNAGLTVKAMSGWSTRGRAWNETGPGLVGVMMHHTATASATGSTGAPSLEWCMNRSGRYPFCNAVIGRDGVVYLLTALSAWHSGKGGPWDAAGVPKDRGERSIFGVEIDDPGRSKTLTKAQIVAAGKLASALSGLCGWPTTRIITHYNWTNGSGGVMSGYRGPQDADGNDGTPRVRVLPTYGRKNDTKYSHDFWRLEAAKYKPASVKPPYTITVGGRTPVSHARAAQILGMSNNRFRVWNGNLPDPLPAGTVLRVPGDIKPKPVHAGQ